MKRLAVVTWHPPESDAIAAQRVRAFLRHLPEYGWIPVLVTSSASPNAEAHARLVVGDPILRMRMGLNRFPPVIRRILSAVMFRLLLPDEQVIWSKLALALVRNLEVDAVLVTGPPFSQFTVSRAGNCVKPVVLDYRDLWTGGTYFNASGVRAWVATRRERIAWRNAAGALTVSIPLANDLRMTSKLDVAVVKNGIAESEIAPDQTLDTLGPLTLMYAGQLYAGRRDPTPLFKALAEASMGPDDVRVDFYVPNPEWVMELADGYDVSSLVHAHPLVPRSEILELQRSSDLLLLLMWDDPGEVGVYSGKLFEYIAARRPVLMHGYKGGVAAELIQERGLGVVSNDSKEIKVMLGEWVAAKRNGVLTQPLAADTSIGITRREQVREAVRFLDQLLDDQHQADA